MPDWYPDLLDSVIAHVAQGDRRAVRAAANTQLLLAYWLIGREILVRQQREGCGNRHTWLGFASVRQRS